MEPVRFGSDFKNQPRIGQRYIQSTAGAVTVKGGKGELQVQKVNVKRYIAGKKPEWAPENSSEEESEDEGQDDVEENIDSPRQIRVEDIEDDLVQDEEEEVPRGDHGRRKIYEPRIVTGHDSDAEEEREIVHERPSRQRRREESSEEDAEDEEEEDDDEDLDEAAIERRRQLLRMKVKQAQSTNKDLLDIEDEEEEEEEDDEESSEYEEYSDSDEEAGLRLKPVFVRKNDRVTVQERERLQEEIDVPEEKMKKVLEDRKKQSTRMVTDIIRGELKEEQGVEKDENLIITDDENDEEEYEAWKVRELKRIKRDKDEKEQREREALEVEKWRNMTEDERKDELRKNPKVITNKSTKGKYKFLQKYYHRGAFFMDKEDGVYTRDFTGATLEDHFDKTVLPKVMQVKNFGRSGRTKYTHLVDQDTTNADSPWFSETSQNMKFQSKLGGGASQSFERPSRKKK